MVMALQPSPCLQAGQGPPFVEPLRGSAAHLCTLSARMLIPTVRWILFACCGPFFPVSRQA